LNATLEALDNCQNASTPKSNPQWQQRILAGASKAGAVYEDSEVPNL
ncbi:hypothetical protein KL920_005450, partial [Ogataea angusta]